MDDLPALEDHRSVKVWLTYLAEGVASGQVSKGLSAEVRKVLKTWVRVHRAEVTDEQLADLRDQIAQQRERVERGSEPWR